VPYLTPQDLPEGEDCRPLFIPAGSEWLALFGGALTELQKPYNWEDSGGLSVEETTDKMAEIIQNWYTEPCEGCELPEGGEIIRIGADGMIEVLTDGEWVTPTEGDYYIPPPEAREEGTEPDQICLAAKNAVNVLEILYESLSDSWNNALDEAEAVTAFIVAANEALGFFIAPITAGIVVFLAPIFAGVYALLEFLIADLWDEAVSAQITCFLIECASNDAGVVTFDYECFLDKMRANINLFDLTEEQLRLYGQIAYMLLFIGGADGLNLAGGTTAITDDDCSFCDDCGELTCNFEGGACDGFYIATSNAAGFYLFPVYPGSTGTFETIGAPFSGEGWIKSVNFPSTGQERSCMLIVLPDGCSTVNSFSIKRYLDSNVSNYNYIEMFDDTMTAIHDQTVTGASWGGWYDLSWTEGVQTGVKYIMVMLDSQDGSVNGIGHVVVGTDAP